MEMFAHQVVLRMDSSCDFKMLLGGDGSLLDCLAGAVNDGVILLIVATPANGDPESGAVRSCTYDAMGRISSIIFFARGVRRSLNSSRPLDSA
jgi:hypothetical protein